MATLDESTLQAVNNANFKSVAEMGVLNALAHQNRMNILAESFIAKSVENIHSTSVEEGLGSAAASRGDLSKIMAELGNVVATLQQSMKGAQTTPPPTTGQ